MTSKITPFLSWPVITLTLSIFGLAVCNVQGQELDKAAFLELHSSLETKNEKWKTIPWETDLLVAQEMAVKSKKPIFMWAMDGHPLGCT